jgi:hypothetical protein
VEKHAVRFSKIKSIEEDGFEDVYCLSVPETGNFLANGIVVRNCDALRYAIASAFPRGELSHPDENLTIDQLKRKVFQDEGYGFINPQMGGGYF